ncbi:MAG: hydroxymethylpyrimidine/phosphomethylpyrimidine kinase [Chromatiales bacterium]|nr:hydroxymethylpyrimidine/phosphomethylpyrimidine kinase [Chromatiales bacterium]
MNKILYYQPSDYQPRGALAPASVPVVLAVCGADPSGGAGIQADIETLASMGCHTAPIITALTAQNTRESMGYQPTDPALIERQLALLSAELHIAACKIGMIASAEIATAVHQVLAAHPEIPVVLDPVLAAGSGGALSNDATRAALIRELIPLATLVTPNSEEARQLVPHAKTLDECATALLALGAEYVLITGTHERTPAVVNALYGEGRLIESWSWERLPGSYHGSGCTLAAAIAGLLAGGASPEDAVREAQEYTWESLRQSYVISQRGQRIPNRLFWAQQNRFR